MVIHKGVPNRFRVNNEHRAGSATVKATRLVNPNLTWTGQSRRLDLQLAAIKTFHRSMACATVLTIAAVIEAKENMPFVIRRCWLGITDSAGLCVAF